MQRAAQCLRGSLRDRGFGGTSVQQHLFLPGLSAAHGVNHPRRGLLPEGTRAVRGGSARYTFAARIADAKSIITFALSAA
jgi:hypothetical protein